MIKTNRLKTVKRAAAAVLAGLAMMTMTACHREPDAKQLVQATLDAALKNEPEAYAEMTGMEKEEVSALYQEEMNRFREEMINSGMDEKIMPVLEEYFAQVLSSLRYEVGEAKKSSNGSYEVTVSYEPIAFGAQAGKLFAQKLTAYVEDMTKRAMDGDTSALLDENAAEQKSMELLMESFSETMFEPFIYGAQEEMTFHVIKDGDYYTVDRDDLASFGQKCIDFTAYMNSLNELNNFEQE